MTAATTPSDHPGAAGPADDVATLPGRFMLPDRSEHPCQVSQLSADRAVFHISMLPPPGLAIVAYIDGIGRVEGTCQGPVDRGFAVEFNHTGARRSRFEKRLGRAAVPGERQRSSAEHGEPKQGVSQIALPDGRTYPCEVIDISLTGAVVKSDTIPTLGTHVMLGRMRGRVVQHIEHGVMIEFVRPTDKGAPTTAGA
ncbi:MAG: PilZ domain-containing protein [Pseudomonadota bacterium]|nr:PilZ domain-containing protein [Pseudomonadota bacterium]